MSEILALTATLNLQTLANAARFPFLLVDFGFSEPTWWHGVTRASDDPATELTWLTPFPRGTTIKLARAITMLAWHTVRTDTEASVVLLGITSDVASILKSLRLPHIDNLAERHASRVRLRWSEQPGVWRQLFACAKSTEVEKAHEFVLHALQLTAAGAFPKPDGRAMARRL